MMILHELNFDAVHIAAVFVKEKLNNRNNKSVVEEVLTDILTKLSQWWF